MVVDQFGEEFFQLLVKSVGNSLALQHIDQLYRTPYAQDAGSGGAVFLEHVDMGKKIDNIIVPKAKTNISPISDYEGKVVNSILSLPLSERSNIWEKYCFLRLVAPLCVQLNDEQAYVWRALSRVMLKLLLNFQKKINLLDDSINISVLQADELCSYLDNMISKGE